jgi:hypothetical protein
MGEVPERLSEILKAALPLILFDFAPIQDTKHPSSTRLTGSLSPSFKVVLGSLTPVQVEPAETDPPLKSAVWPVFASDSKPHPCGRPCAQLHFEVSS